MPFYSAIEEDITRAHYFALGALHAHYRLTDWAEIYDIATGFTYYYRSNMASGIGTAWDVYVAALSDIQFIKVRKS